MYKPYEHSGKVLKQIREDLGLTQKEMGKILEMHTQFISNTERGLSFVTKKAFNLIVVKLNAREDKNLLRKFKESIKSDLYNDFVSNKLEEKNAKIFF